MSGPRPLCLSLIIPTRIHCSRCFDSHVVPELPLVFVEPNAPTLDQKALLVMLPEGWRVGAMKPLGLGLHLPGGPPPDAKPMPAAFCPTCKALPPPPGSGS